LQITDLRAIAGDGAVRVTLLPAAGHGPGPQFLTSFLLNDTVAVDAGTLGVYRGAAEQARVRHVLLSHSHMDHLATLPIFLDTVYQGGPDCVTVHGSDDVLDCLRRDVFNDRVWPDFIRMSDGRAPFLRLRRLEPGRAVELDGLRITPVPVHHAVPTLGFLVSDGSSTVVIPSDTGPTEEIWERASAAADLKAVFLEASFPDAQAELAAVSRHLTPALFAGEARKLCRPARLIAVHISPRFYPEVVRELLALGLPDLEIGEPGKTYCF
jgi:ribonuclease BN (tRNA processing enzyme)